MTQKSPQALKRTGDRNEDGINRSRNKPAVTRVEECTKDETGVGADMAAGSQGEKGNCALLVKEAEASNTKRGLNPKEIRPNEG